ncbi:MAG: ribosome maturation factor RimM [Pseudonocardiaceae bacterium]
MPAQPRLVTAGRVGRPHGLDGSFWVEAAAHGLPAGTRVSVSGVERLIEGRSGTEERPLIRLRGVHDRNAAAALGGELLLVSEHDAPLADDEWLAGDLEGCLVPGLGRVCRVVGTPSCDVLELDDGTLVPLVPDAVKSIDLDKGRIEVDHRFLGHEDREV